MTRGLLGLALLAALLAGCARSGHATGAPVPSYRPTGPLADCVDRPDRPPPVVQGSPVPTVVPSAVASVMNRIRDEERAPYRRKHAVNGRPLPPAVDAANEECAYAVLRELVLLDAAHRYDAATLTSALTVHGLTEVVVRTRSGGLLFGAWTGQACVFGAFGPGLTDVDYGARTARGECL